MATTTENAKFLSGIHKLPPPHEKIAMDGEGLVSETFPRVLASTQGANSSQTFYVVRIPLRAEDVVTNLIVGVTTAGAGAAPTLIKLGLLDKTGKVLQQSANEAADSKWTSLGFKAVAMAAPYAVTADDLYYAAFLINGVFGGTNIQFARTPVANTGGYFAAIGSGVAIINSQTGVTDFPATGSSQTLSAGSVVGMWFGVT
jgi:hypothetical protein